MWTAEPDGLLCFQSSDFLRASRGQDPGAAMKILFFAPTSSTLWLLLGEGGQIIRSTDLRQAGSQSKEHTR